MSNRNSKKEKQELNNAAEKLVVDYELRSRASDNLDKSIHNMKVMEDNLNNQINNKRDLLNTLKAKRQRNNNNDYKEIKQKINQTKQVSAETPNIIETYSVRTMDINDDSLKSAKYNRKFAEEEGVNLDNPYSDLLTNYEKAQFAEKMIDQFDLIMLEDMDYGFAACAGLIAGIVDVVLIGTNSKGDDRGELVKKVDKAYLKIVDNYGKHLKIADTNKQLNQAKTPIDKVKRDEIINNIKNNDEHIGVRHLRKNKVLYDAVNHPDVPGMKVQNHRNASLAHDFSPLGLIFGVLDQLTGKATYISPNTGDIVRTVAESIPLEGNMVQQVIKAINNWFEHCLSDISASESFKTRGTGLPAPFWSYLQSLNAGSIKNVKGDEFFTIGELSGWMFEQGYDHRAFTSEIITILIFEILIRAYWFCKQYFYYGKSLEESKKMMKSRELSRLIFVGSATFSAIDTGHAVIKSIGSAKFSGVDIGTLVLTINKAGLVDLGIRSFQAARDEIKHRKHVENVLKNDVRDEYYRVMNDNRI